MGGGKSEVTFFHLNLLGTMYTAFVMQSSKNVSEVVIIRYGI